MYKYATLELEDKLVNRSRESMSSTDILRLLEDEKLLRETKVTEISLERDSLLRERENLRRTAEGKASCDSAVSGGSAVLPASVLGTLKAQNAFAMQATQAMMVALSETSDPSAMTSSESVLLRQLADLEEGLQRDLHSAKRAKVDADNKVISLTKQLENLKKQLDQIHQSVTDTASKTKVEEASEVKHKEETDSLQHELICLKKDINMYKNDIQHFEEKALARQRIVDAAQVRAEEAAAACESIRSQLKLARTSLMNFQTTSVRRRSAVIALEADVVAGNRDLKVLHSDRRRLQKELLKSRSEAHSALARLASLQAASEEMQSRLGTPTLRDDDSMRLDDQLEDAVSIENISRSLDLLRSYNGQPIVSTLGLRM